jgi:hypothetical protein
MRTFWLSLSPDIGACIDDSLFRRSSVEVLVVGLRAVAGMVDYAVPMIRERKTVHLPMRNCHEER